MTSCSLFFLCTAVLAMEFSAVCAQEKRISGEMYCDYFYEFSHPDSETDALDRNGFRFTRIYFTYDHDLSETFAVRFRLESSSGDFGKSELMVPFVKHAYLSWRDLIPESKLYFGMSSTPTWNISENVWGYRSVEKTIMDLRRAASSADLGIALQGKCGKSGVVGYHIMAANGTGTKSEADKNKRLYVSVPIKIRKAYVVVPYLDYEGGNSGGDKKMVALFAGMQNSGFQGGVEAFQKTSGKAAADGRDKTEVGVSVFGAVKATNRITLFGRLDLYDPNTDVDGDRDTLLIAGSDFAAGQNVQVIPNFRVESYEGEDMDSNVVSVLTVFFKL